MKRAVFLAVLILRGAVAPSEALLAQVREVHPAGRIRYRPEQVHDFEASFRYGQTFLVWTEVAAPGARYRVYRSLSPIDSPDDLSAATAIASLGDSTSINARETEITGLLTTYVIREGDPPLSTSECLYVWTAQEVASAYYAVTAVVGGTENPEITPGPGGNSISEPLAETVDFPEPVRQSSEAPAEALYTHWVSNVSTPLYPAMANQNGRAYNFRVQNIQEAPPSPQGILLRLHGRGGSYRGPGFERPDPGRPLVISPDDDLPLVGNSFWYGYNSNYRTGRPLVEGRNIDYTQRRLLYYVDWAIATFPVDWARVYVVGQSMGAIGAVILAIGHPDRIAGVLGVSPKVNFRDTVWVGAQTVESLWGTVEQDIATEEGIGIYDRLNAGWMAERRRTSGLPIIALFAGRSDTGLGWSEKPPFFRTLVSHRLGGFLFWDLRGHWPNNTGYWDYRIAAVTEDLFRYRLDQSFPAVTGMDLDGDPGNGDPADGDSVGTLGGYVTWDTETIVDQPDLYEVTLLLTPDAPGDTARGDVTPRRLQAFAPIPGETLIYSTLRLSDTTLVQWGVLGVDSLGLATAPRVPLSKTGSRLRLRRPAPAPRGASAELSGATDAPIGLGVPRPGRSHPEIVIPLTLRTEPGDLDRHRRLELGVYTVRGRLVRILLKGGLPPGVREVIWDRRNDKGQLLPPGLYLIRLRCAGAAQTRRIVASP